MDFHASDVHAPELGHVVEHHVLLRHLEHQLDIESQLDILRSSVSTYDRSSNVVTLTNGQRLTSALVIAADGGQSFIRTKSGLGTWGWTYDQKSVVAVVKTDDCHDSGSHHHPAYQRFCTTGPIALLPMRDGFSSVVWTCPTEMANSLVRCDPQAFLEALNHALQDLPRSTSSHFLETAMNSVLAASQLSQATTSTAFPSPPHISQLSSTSRASFPLQCQHASVYAKPGVVVVGDAAHSVHPLAGQGLNLGLEDVKSLARVLGEGVSRGQDVGCLGLLESYERERKAKNVAMSLVMDTFTRLFGAEDAGSSSSSLLQKLFRTSRNLGLGLFNRSGPVKQQVIRVAMGTTSATSVRQS